jgi:hypothetical protein
VERAHGTVTGVGGDLVGSQFVCDQGPFKGVAEVYMIRKCGGLIETLKRRGQLMERHLFLRSQLPRREVRFSLSLRVYCVLKINLNEKNKSH